MDNKGHEAHLLLEDLVLELLQLLQLVQPELLLKQDLRRRLRLLRRALLLARRVHGRQQVLKGFRAEGQVGHRRQRRLR